METPLHSTRNWTIGGASCTRPWRGIATTSPCCTLCCCCTIWPFTKVPARLKFFNISFSPFDEISKCCLETAFLKVSSGTKEDQNSGACIDLPTRMLPVGPGNNLEAAESKQLKQRPNVPNGFWASDRSFGGAARHTFSWRAGRLPYSQSIYPALMMSPGWWLQNWANKCSTQMILIRQMLV